MNRSQLSQKTNLYLPPKKENKLQKPNTKNTVVVVSRAKTLYYSTTKIQSCHIRGHSRHRDFFFPFFLGFGFGFSFSFLLGFIGVILTFAKISLYLT